MGDETKPAKLMKHCDFHQMENHHGDALPHEKWWLYNRRPVAAHGPKECRSLGEKYWLVSFCQ